MQYVTLGMTGLRVSRIALGTWQLGGDWGRTDEDAAIATIHRSRELGINLFDTAQGYGWGESERLLGRALRDDIAHRREEIVIATKGGLSFSDGQLSRDSSADELRRAVDESLAALGVEHIDIYQVHWPDASVPMRETAAALDDLVRAGKIGHVGVSNFDVAQMREFASSRPVETLQPALSLLRRDVEKEILPYADQTSIGVLAYGPLAHGLLSGAVDAGTSFAKGDWRARDREFSGPAFERNVTVAAQLQAFARESIGCSLSQLALSWVLGCAGVHSAIVGTRNLAHIEEAARATDIDLSESQRMQAEAIADAGERMLGVTPEGF